MRGLMSRRHLLAMSVFLNVWFTAVAAPNNPLDFKVGETREFVTHAATFKARVEIVHESGWLFVRPDFKEYNGGSSLARFWLNVNQVTAVSLPGEGMSGVDWTPEQKVAYDAKIKESLEQSRGVKSELVATRLVQEVIKTAILKYRQHTGAVPSQLSGLVENDGTPGWSGPYLGSVPKDGWGSDFLYQVDGTKAAVASIGAPGSDMKIISVVK